MTEKDSRKHAIVTGGSRGIGRAICIELAKDGYFIAINYISNDSAAAETLAMVKSAGGGGKLYKFDVRDSAASENFINNIYSEFSAVDVLVNNAGITTDALFVMTEKKDWDSIISTTLSGFYNMTKPVIQKMMRSRSGSIVSISSVSGLIGNRGQAAYSAAKAGLIGASRSVASEVARLGIRVNVVAPGLIDTEMIAKAPVENIKQLIPIGRIGKPEEVAKTVRFLCSDDASYITGQVISVNGGMI